MSNFTIRPYHHNGEQSVIEIWMACGLTAPQNDPKRDIERKLQVNPEWFLVGELDEKQIATCMAGYEGHRGWINYLAVLPEHQRNGYAARMMRQAEHLLREEGCPKINLQVRSLNTKVIDFYKTIGYKIDEVVSMGKRLQDDH